ncbi:hypothetical protein [Lacticaseibacillus nasuensis]|uniref:hypothetical protein n=1 Tax=Lacticaseibacillus nasuensis TaxID=944671 RepID=UPI0022478E02|nr:hypothetical protein [Lacticaseibacillus nasuensis]MCX2455199.1 hypothetical protein [Lacticaseibacillus nasuensis]
MNTMSKTVAWVMVALNLVLIGLVATMHNMAAMYLMAFIMLGDSLWSLHGCYAHGEAHK